MGPGSGSAGEMRRFGRADGEGMAVGPDLSSISAFFLTLAEPQSL